jgi:hypothetical protein
MGVVWIVVVSLGTIALGWVLAAVVLALSALAD